MYSVKARLRVSTNWPRADALPAEHDCSAASHNVLLAREMPHIRRRRIWQSNPISLISKERRDTTMCSGWNMKAAHDQHFGKVVGSRLPSMMIARVRHSHLSGGQTPIVAGSVSDMEFFEDHVCWVLRCTPVCLEAPLQKRENSEHFS